MEESGRRDLARAVELAEQAGARGAPPVGAVVILDGDIAGEGAHGDDESDGPLAHAEMAAIGDVSPSMWREAEGGTCVATLEPCAACTCALFAYGVRRIVFGSSDDRGGAGGVVDRLAEIYRPAEGVEWIGPVGSDACDAYARRAIRKLGERSVGSLPWSGAKGVSPADPKRLRRELDAWVRGVSDDLSLQQARARLERLTAEASPGELEELLPAAVEVFRRGGYVKDYRALETYARNAGEIEILETVEETLREDLPDVWVRRALERGETEAAVERWYEIEGHPRARHVADELVEAAGEDRAQLLISCRLARVSHMVERGGRRHYRRACTVLRKLRDELERLRRLEYWQHVLADLRERYDNRPAFLDELDKASLG